MYRQSEKNLLNSNISSTCFYNMANFGPSTAEIGWRVWDTPTNFNGFRVLASLCSDVVHRRPAKLCRMFGRLLGWHTIDSSSGDIAPDGILLGATCLFLYWQRYCTVLQQRASAKLCGLVGLQGMELRHFRRGCHLCSSGRPSRWASAHILVAY